MNGLIVGHAVVDGHQHLMTFDKTYYDFSSTCGSYVLARDFVNKTFSVIINGYGDEEKSLTIDDGVNLIDIRLR